MERSPKEELEELLSESPQAVRSREAAAFDRISEGRPIVLFGMGGLGRKVLQGLAALDIHPVALADNNPKLWNQNASGIPIQSPGEVADRWRNEAVFVVTIWRAGGGRDFLSAHRQLSELGCTRIASFAKLFWKFPEIFLPYYAIDLPHKILEQRARILDCYAILADDGSRCEFVQQLRWRLFLDYEHLSSPVPGAQYFPEDIIRLNQEEVFVDGGAFDGDTWRIFLKKTNGAFNEYWGFEPDSANFNKLSASVTQSFEKSGSRIHLSQCALSDKKGQVRFAGDGTASAQAHAQGSHEVTCVTLDETLDDSRPTYIKLDIEGAELAALQGGRKIIKSALPKLAVCAYHLQNHLWEVPLLAHEILAASHIYLRAHNEEAFDLVCYALPARD